MKDNQEREVARRRRKKQRRVVHAISQALELDKIDDLPLVEKFLRRKNKKGGHVLNRDKPLP